MSFLELFGHVDDFCQRFLPYWDQQFRAHGQRVRCRAGQLSMSELMTIVIYFHQMRFRDFKSYYLGYVLGHRHRKLPKPSPTSVNSTALAVCYNRWIPHHRVFRSLAQRGKTSLGWFYGFKLHVVINYHGELLACQLTPGNIASPTNFAVKLVAGLIAYCHQPDNPPWIATDDHH